MNTVKIQEPFPIVQIEAVKCADLKFYLDPPREFEVEYPRRVFKYKFDTKLDKLSNYTIFGEDLTKYYLLPIYTSHMREFQGEDEAGQSPF